MGAPMPQFPIGSRRRLPMRTVTLEEHFTVPSLVARYLTREVIARRGFGSRTVLPGRANPLDLLPEIGEKRLASMDAAGITVRVLSSSGPGDAGRAHGGQPLLANLGQQIQWVGTT